MIPKTWLSVTLFCKLWLYILYYRLWVPLCVCVYIYIFLFVCFFTLVSLLLEIFYLGTHFLFQGFPGGSDGKSLPAMWETQVRSLVQEDPLEKEMATHSSILAWKIPWMDKPGSPWGHKESDMTERLDFHFHFCFQHQKEIILQYSVRLS